MIKKILKNASVKNASWIIFGRVIQMLISLVVGLMTARHLGPSNYGLINYAGAYTAFFMAFCTLGINSVLVKEFVDNPNDEGTIIGSTLVMRGISSLLSAGIIVCFVGVLDADEPTTIFVTVLCSISLIFHIFEVFNYWFQSKLRSKVTAMTTLTAYIITSVYKIILLICGKSVEWFAFATSLDYICIGVLLFTCYKKQGGGRLEFSTRVCRRILGRSVHFILPSLMVSIYGYADKFMLKHMMSEADVGYYSTAAAVCSMWCFVLSAIIDSMNPVIMQAFNEDKVKFERLNKVLYCIVFYLAAFVSIAFTVLGELVIFILYGEAFLPAAAPLKVITWYTAFSYLGVARNSWIVCENKQKYLKYIYISAALSNMVLNFIFIPMWGAVGAAVASLITQIITVMIVPFFIKNIRKNSVLMLEAVLFKGLKGNK